MNWSPDRFFRSFILNKKSFAKIREGWWSIPKSKRLHHILLFLFKFTHKTYTLTICARTEKLAFVVALPDCLTDCLKFAFPSLPIKPNSNGVGFKWYCHEKLKVVKHFKLLPETHKFTDETQVVHFHYQDSWICRKELIKLRIKVEIFKLNKKILSKELIKLMILSRNYELSFYT